MVAAAGLPLLALLLLLPERPFSILVTVLLVGATIEFTRATMPRAGWSPVLAGGAAAALIVAGARTAQGPPLWGLLPAAALAIAGVLRPAREDRALRWPGAAWWVAGVCYVGVLGAHFPLLRAEADGVRWLVVLLGVTFVTDTAAYAVGRLLGRHLFVPALSPKKTWEGAAGGYAGGAAAAVLVPLLLDVDPAAWQLAVLAVVLPAAAIGGDLLESALKRRAGLKDFSRLLPGHGGLLDRLDSLLLVGPSLYWLLQWFDA